jgi:hypothetical protein
MNFSKISKPITELLKKDTKYVWSKDCDEAFSDVEEITNHIASASVA